MGRIGRETGKHIKELLSEKYSKMALSKKGGGRKKGLHGGKNSKIIQKEAI